MKWHVQFSRYAIVGLASNTLGYLLYLLLTYSGLGPKLTMTLLYAIGVAQTFIFNRKWSFEHDGKASSALIRYISSYALGYFINLFVLFWLVDLWGWPHQWVQGAMILLLAAMLFLLQRFWVFRSNQITRD